MGKIVLDQIETDNYFSEMPFIEIEDETEEKGTEHLRLDESWCGGMKKRGCGTKINLFLARREGDFFICPTCGRRN